MSRRRQRNPLGLPRHVYENHGAFFYVDRAHHWHRLGERWDTAARQKWALLSGETSASDGTVAALLDAFLEYAQTKVAEGKRAQRTLEDNRAEAEMLKRSFGAWAAAKIESRDVSAYLAAALKANRGIRANREKALLSSAYSWGMSEWGLPSNPCYGVRRNPEHPRQRSPEAWELRKFGKRYCPTWLRCYILLKYLTGCRQGDLLRLTRSDEAAKSLLTREGKKHDRKRAYRWTWTLKTVWRAALSARKLKPGKVAPACVFFTRDGSPLTQRGFKSAWQRSMAKWCADGHERFTEHDIRSRTANDAGSMKRAQEVLGDGSAIRVYRRGVQKVRPIR